MTVYDKIYYDNKRDEILKRKKDHYKNDRDKILKYQRK